MKDTINENFQNTIIVTGAVLLGSVFSYLLQWFMGRNLSVADYGTFNSLLSVAAIVGVPSVVLSTAVVKRVSALKGSEGKDKINIYYWNISLFSIVLVVLVTSIFYFFRTSILGFINIYDARLVSLFGFYISLSFLWATPYAFLQGLQMYKSFSAFILFAAITRLILPTIAVFNGMHLNGLFIGLTFAVIFSYFFAIGFLRKYIFPGIKGSAYKDIISTIKFSIPVMITNICLTFLINNDLILVKKFFDPETVGFYAGTVTLGKILLFGASSVSIVMFPKIAALKESKGNISKTFYQFFFLQMAIVVAGLLVFVLFPKFIAIVFFGTKFLSSVAFLPLFSVFVSLYVLLNYLTLFLLAIDVTNVYYYLLPLIVLQYLLINAFHNSIHQVILMNVLLLLVGCVLTLYKSTKAVKAF